MRVLLLTVTLGLATTAVAQNAAPPPVPRPERYVTREAWGSMPDPIPATRKHTPKWITIHHAGVLWTNTSTP